jgi:signal transduction histidine kinase
LVVGSVLACWLVGFVILFLYSRSLSWTDDRARTDGVFLVHEILNQEKASKRTGRVRELQEHFSVQYSLISINEAERRVGRPVRPGERIPHIVSAKEEWYILIFEDGQGALAAGPVNPATAPAGFLPVGMILAIVGLPLIAGLLALRVERELRKVERASVALAVGELSARVDNPRGPSNELAASFNTMAERVEHLIRSRDELVQAVSHELGSPLSRLRFHVELLENQSDGNHEERLDAMARELDALDELVSELLGYVQCDERKIDLHVFDPNRSLADLVELATLEAPEGRKIEVDLKLPSGISIFADQRLFQRAVENILRNALQHARSRVLLELTQDGVHVRVAVHDDGPGIPEEMREKVVIPFFRLQKDRGRETGGTGLGLAIVSRIMQRHGGRLTIASSPLGGTTVSMMWPRPG